MAFSKTAALKAASKYVQQGKYQAAIEEYRRVVQADPNDITTLNILGDLCVKAGETAEAIRSFVRVAEYYRKNSSKSKAIAMLKKAGKLDPSSVEIALRLAALYSEENLMVEAQQQYLAAAEHYLRVGQNEQALGLYQKLAELDPENTTIQLRLAEAHLRAQHPGQAYEAFFAAAIELQRQGKPEEALKTFLKALKAKPEGRKALSAAVSLYIQRGETQPAESLIKHLLRMRPDDPELLALLGRVHQVSYDLEAAKHAIARAVEVDPSCFQYQVDLVSAGDRAYATFFAAAGELQKQGRYEEALQTYLKALKVKPEGLNALSAAVNIYLQRGEAKGAVMLIRHLLRARPDDPELLIMLGRVHLEANDLDAAEQTISRAVLLNPACFQYLLSLAFFFRRKGDPDRALLQLDRVIEILHDRGEQGKAITLLREVIAGDPNHLGALERLAFIYSRARDHQNLTETLNSLAHAAIYKGENELAITVLRQLVELEPGEVWHQRLLLSLDGRGEEMPPLEMPSPAPAAISSELAAAAPAQPSPGVAAVDDRSATARSADPVSDAEAPDVEPSAQSLGFAIAEESDQELNEPLAAPIVVDLDLSADLNQPAIEVQVIDESPAADLGEGSVLRFEVQPKVLSYIAWLGRSRGRGRRPTVLADSIRTQRRTRPRRRPGK